MTNKTNSKRSKFEPVAYQVDSRHEAEVVPLAIARAHAIRVVVEPMDPEERRIWEAAERRRKIREAARRQQMQNQKTERRKQIRAWKDIRSVLGAITVPLLNLFWISALWIWIKSNWDHIGNFIWHMINYTF